MDDADDVMNPSDGFIYDNLGTKKGITYYRCAKRCGYFCNGSRKKLVNGRYVTIQPHNGHPPDNANASIVKAFRDVLKRRATSENSSFKSIYDNEARRNLDASALYAYSTAESTMRLARRNSLPPLPPSLADLAHLFEIGSLGQYTCCGETLFKCCVRDVDGRASMIFGCTALIQLVGHDIEEIHIDATFKVVPSNMGRQMMSIHCMIGNHSIPIVYCLMEAKSRNSYNSVFSFLKLNLLANLNPTVIITDYETALRDTLTFFFPNTRTVGCWFHHNQAVWKNMKRKGYLNLTNSNECAMTALRMLMALPLLPSADIQRGFDVVRMYAINHNVPMVDFFDYYQNFWLRRVGVDALSVNGLPRRTNNCVESFHNGLRMKFNVIHPNLWIFLDHLSHLNKNTHITLTQLLNNLRPTRKQTSKVIMNLKRINDSTQEYSLGLITMWQFLCRTAHATSAYEERQRHWAVYVDAEIPPLLAARPPLEVAAARPPPEAAAGRPPPEEAVERQPPVATPARPPPEVPPVRPQPEVAAARPPLVATPATPPLEEAVERPPPEVPPVRPQPEVAAARPPLVATPATPPLEEAVERPPPEVPPVRPQPEVAAARPPLVATPATPPLEEAVERPPPEVPPVRPQPEVAAGRPRPALAVRRRSASARGHPYNHQENRRQRSDAAAAWDWFFAEDLNRVELDENQELQDETRELDQSHGNEEILEICVICIQRISHITVVPCKHMFCKRCIERWMEEGNEGCPLCRTHIIRLLN